jgi:iron complex outermembrane receptor protein
MKISKAKILGCGASLAIAVALSSAAQAQNSVESETPVGDIVVGEIVVTAQKQSQSLQKAPVAITAIDSKALTSAGVTDIRAAQAFVPSVRFQQQNAATEIYIRGVGSTLDFPQVDPPNAFHFNGIYVPREGTSVPIYDVSQLEVLPGPQGTLYGRSALGGVVNVSLNRPTNKMETRILAEVGNYSMFHTTFVQNVPVSDTLSIRGAFDYNRHSGYMRSGADSADTWGARLSLEYKPSSEFTAYLWGAFVDKSGSPPNLVAKGVTPTGALSVGSFIQNDPYNDLLPPALLAISPFGQVNARDMKYDNRMFGGQFDWRIADNATLTYIPSYLKFNVDVGYWLSGLPSNKNDHFEQTTHELRASGKHNWGSWLIGLYGYNMTSKGEFFVASFDNTGFPVSLIDRNRIKGIAGFGQLTYNITDNFHVTGGGRYSVDTRTGRGRFFNGIGILPFTSNQTYKHFDFKLGFNYAVAPGTMLYATVETGYQPGTYNTFASTPTVSNRVGAANLTAYTAGLKVRFADNKVTWNNEFYYYDYSDLFASAYNTVLNTTQTFNAKKVEIYGVQSDLIFNAGDNDRFNVTLGYLHARNKDFTLPDGTANFDGLQLQYAPDWTISAGYHHDFQMAKGYLRAQVSTRYESSFFADFSHTPGGKQGNYTKTDLSMTYYSEDDKWSLGAWVKNIENEAVIAATAGGSNFPANLQGATSYLEAPRTFGVRGTLNF